MKKIIIRIVAGAFLSCAAMPAMADEKTLLKADELIKGGKPAEAFALLEPMEAKLAGDPAFDYLLATAALQAGNPSRATFIYERILAINPNFVGVRADMGRAYYQMGDLARAKLEFESILTIANLPPDLRSAVESYLSALAQVERGKKLIITGYGEIGFGRDNNVLSQTSNQTIRLANGTSFALGATDLKRSDSLFSYGAGVELQNNMDGGLAVYAGGDIRGREYRKINAADNYSVDGRAGLQYASGDHLLRGGFSAGRYVLDNVSTRDSTGVNLDWRYLVNANNQLSLNGAVSALRYIPAASKVEDFNNYSLNFGWTHVLAASTVGVLTLTGGREDATRGRADGDKKYWGLRGTLQHSFSPKLGTFVTAGTQPGSYSRFNTTYGVNRKDRLADMALGLVWSLPDRWSVRPLVSFTENRSNADVYQYSRRDASVSLRKDF